MNSSVRSLSYLAVLGLILLSAPILAAQEGDAKPVDFSREILPVLSDKCFICHGPDGTDKDILRLDSFAAATHDLGGYRAIDPGAPEKSEMLKRIQSADDPMPPADAEKQLTDAEHNDWRAGFDRAASTQSTGHSSRHEKRFPPAECRVARATSLMPFWASPEGTRNRLC